MTENKDKKCVAYYRVSTKNQEKSGLGLEAQKSVCTQAVEQTGGKIEKEFVEVESGKNDSRPLLLQAIAFARLNNFTLVVSSLDRLGRNAKYLFEIRDNVKNLFIVSHPSMTTLEFGIYATFAQEERERISSRTKAALKARFEKTGKKNGNKKGQGPSREVHDNRVRVIKERYINMNHNLVASNIVKENLNLTYAELAKKLTGYGLRAGGLYGEKGAWTAYRVRTLCKNYGIIKPSCRFKKNRKENN